MDEAQRLLLTVEILKYLFAFAVGSTVGSFTGVVIYRLPRKLSFVKGFSFCPECGRRLGVLDLVPVWSYLLLGGKCRTCGARIPIRCLIEELLGGLIACLCVMQFGYSWQCLATFAVLAALIAVSFIDADTSEIPNGLIIFLLLPAAALLFITPDTPILSHIIGAFCVSLPLLLISLFIKGAFGGGDVKLMFACGLALGWQNTVLAFFIALLSGGAYAVYLLAVRKAGRKSQFSFGPFLSAGVCVSALFGAEIIGAYLSLL